MAAVPPARASVAAAGVQAGDFIGAQCNVGGVGLNGRPAALAPPGRPETAGVVTPDGDECEETVVNDINVLKWSIFPGGAAGGTFVWAGGAPLPPRADGGAGTGCR